MYKCCDIRSVDITIGCTERCGTQVALSTISDRQPALNDLLNVIVSDLCRLGLTPAQLSPGDPSNRLAESSDLQANVALQYAERQQSSMAK